MKKTLVLAVGLAFVFVACKKDPVASPTETYPQVFEPSAVSSPSGIRYITMTSEISAPNCNAAKDSRLNNIDEYLNELITGEEKEVYTLLSTSQIKLELVFPGGSFDTVMNYSRSGDKITVPGFTQLTMTTDGFTRPNFYGTIGDTSKTAFFPVRLYFEPGTYGGDITVEGTVRAEMGQNDTAAFRTFNTVFKKK